MTKQNRALGFLFIFAILILGLILFRAGKLNTNETPAILLEDKGSQELMGDPIQESEPNPAKELKLSEEQKSFLETLKLMSDCLELKTELPMQVDSVSLDVLLKLYQIELGQPLVSDRWISWHMHSKEGQERRLKLEVIENDEGRMVRELHLFAVDKDNVPIPLDIGQEKVKNPTDEVLSQMLKDGDVFFKEKAGSGIFPNGDRLEFIERNSILSEFELLKNDKTFRCSSLKVPKETCQCVK